MRALRGSLLIASVVFAIVALVMWRGGKLGSRASIAVAAAPDVSASDVDIIDGSFTLGSGGERVETARTSSVDESPFARAEVPQHLESSAPKPRANVSIDVSIEGAPSDVVRARVQVIADALSDSFDESAERSIFAEPVPGRLGEYTIDITPLFLDAERMPTLLRVIAHVGTGCETAHTLNVAISPEVMANHRRLEMRCDVRLSCSRAVFGRLTFGREGLQGRVRWSHRISTWNSEGQSEGRTEPDGTFRISAPQPGMFHLVASAPGFIEHVLPVRTQEFDNVDLGDIPLERGERIDGVVSINGRPIPEASLVFVPVGARLSPQQHTETSRSFKFVEVSKDGRTKLSDAPAELDNLRWRGVDVLETPNGELNTDFVVKASQEGRFATDQLRKGRYTVALASSGIELTTLEPATVEVPGDEVKLDFSADIIRLEFVNDHGDLVTPPFFYSATLRGSDGAERHVQDLVSGDGRGLFRIQPGTSVTAHNGNGDFVIPASPRAGDRSFRVTNCENQMRVFRF